MEGESLRFPEEVVESDGLYGYPNDFLVNVRQLFGQCVDTDGKGFTPEYLPYPPGWFRQRGRKVLDRDTRSVTDPLCRPNDRLFGPVVSHC